MDIQNQNDLDVEILFDSDIAFEASLSSSCCCCTAATSETTDESAK